MFKRFCETLLHYYFTLTLFIFILIINVFSFAFKESSYIILISTTLIIPLLAGILIFKRAKGLLNLRRWIFLILIIIFIFRIIFTVIIPYDMASKISSEKIILDIKVLSVSNYENNNIIYKNRLLEIFEENNENNLIYGKKSIIGSSDYGKIIFYDYFENLNQGDIFRAEISFLKPQPPRNPGGFDEKRFLYSKGVFLKGILYEGRYDLIDISNSPVNRITNSLRSMIKETFNSVLPDREAGLLLGIVTGDRSGILKTDKDTLYNAGLSHITAVSGAAISFLVFPIKRLMKKMKINIYFRYVITVIFLVFTGAIAFWTPSVSRAVLMVISILTAEIIVRKINPLQSLLISAIIILFINPYMLFSAGFILSYITVGGIFIFYKLIKNKLEILFSINSIVSSVAAINISACISSLPASLYLFNEISGTSLISNFFVMPLFQMAVTGGFLLALSGILHLPLLLISAIAVPLKGILSAVCFAASIISKFQFLKIKSGFVSVIFLIGILCFLYSALINNKVIKKFMYTILCICVISNSIYYILYFRNKPDLTIVFADVGQGDSTLIIYKNGTSILIDSGSKDKGVKVLNEMMNYYDVKFPSFYIATHMHEDHCGAMAEIIKQRGGEILFVPVFTFSDIIGNGSDNNDLKMDLLISDKPDNPEFVYGFDLLKSAEASGLEIIEAGFGDSLKICESSTITFLNPQKNDSKTREKCGNESSMVTQIDYKGLKILIMGDATNNVENLILNSNQDLKSYVYRISHHGSPTSTNHDIINAVSAKISVISVGYNFYGHPSEEVIRRLEDSGSQIYRTDLHGALIIEVKGNKVRYKSMLDKEEVK